MKDDDKKKEDLIKKLIVFGGVVFVFLSILFGFLLLGFFDLVK